jgi:5-(carboxyamino)imidazole ribonucleotide mutase
VLALSDDDLADRLDAFRARQTAAVPLFPADTE